MDGLKNIFHRSVSLSWLSVEYCVVPTIFSEIRPEKMLSVVGANLRRTYGVHNVCLMRVRGSR